MDIVLDADDVIFRHLDGFFDFVEKKERIRYKSENMKSWNLSELMVDFREGYFLELIKEFAASEGFKQLKPYEDAVETIKKLKDEGHSIYIVSSCLPDKNPELTEKYRKENLKALFGEGFFEEIELLPVSPSSEGGLGNKGNYLKKFAGDNSIFLDDSFKNYKQGIKVGIKNSFLFSDNSWNKVLDAKKSYSWKDFYNKVQKINKQLHNVVCSDPAPMPAFQNSL